MPNETSKNSNIVSTGGGLGFHNLDKHTTNQETKGSPPLCTKMITTVSLKLPVCRSCMTSAVVYQYTIRNIPCILHHLR